MDDHDASSSGLEPHKRGSRIQLPFSGWKGLAISVLATRSAHQETLSECRSHTLHRQLEVAQEEEQVLLLVDQRSSVRLHTEVTGGHVAELQGKLKKSVNQRLRGFGRGFNKTIQRGRGIEL